MKQTLFVCLWAFVWAFCATKAVHATQCNSADLVISRITISNVDGNSVSFSYQVKNVGLSKLYLNRMQFQVYASANTAIDGNDILIGSSFFGNNPPTLDYNQTFNGTYITNSAANLRTYPYIVMTATVRPGQSMPECFTINTLAKYVVNNFGDLQIDSLIRGIGIPGNRTITYFISNQGRSTLDLSKMQWRVYYSIDNIYDMNDPIITANTFSSGNLSLAPGAYKIGDIVINPPANSSQYRYMIFVVTTLWGEVQHESNYDNNTLLTPMSGGSNARTEAFHMEQQNNELHLMNNNQTTEQNHYAVYSVSGELMKEGMFYSKESLNLSAFATGVYVVKITDGTNSEAYKFVVAE